MTYLTTYNRSCLPSGSFILISSSRFFLPSRLAGMPPLQDPPSWSDGNSSMYCVNALAPMRPCDTRQPPAVDGCSVAGSDLDGNVPPGTHTFEDRTIAEDAIDKLRRAAANYRSTGQPFFSAVGFRCVARTCVFCSQ